MKRFTILILSFFTFFCVATAQEQPVTKMRDVIKDGPLIQNPYYNSQTDQTAGDLIKKSAKLRLSGFGVSAAVTTLFLTGTFDSIDNQTKTDIGVLTGIVGIGLYIAGEIVQIKAGDKMKIAPASEGVGLALKF